MDKKTIVSLALLGGIFIALFIAVAWLVPEPTDWRHSFNTREKIPFGLFVLDRELGSLYDNSLEKFKDPFDKWMENLDGDESYEGYGSLLYINNDLKWQHTEIENLTEYIKAGNEALISTAQLPDVLKTSTGVSTGYFNTRYFFGIQGQSVSLSLADTSLSKVKTSSNWYSGQYFDSIPAMNAIVLGHTTSSSERHPNFISITMGKGKLYLHLEPMAFTNYGLLKDNDYLYAQSTLSYLDNTDGVVWLLNGQSAREASASPLRFILSQRGLKWAWYILLAGTFLFMVVNARRSQRIIKTIVQPSNSSVEFVRTIGNLYHLEGDTRKVIDNKIKFFLEKVRSDYHTGTENLDDTFVHQLITRSGKNEKVIRQIVFLINKHQQFDYTCTEADLVRINEAIENFYI